MCGIYGLLDINKGPIKNSYIDVLSNQMIYRGPDDRGDVIKDSWAIGMRRLSIIDIAGGQQPISNLKQDIHLVANGEIYNYKELRKKLQKLGYEFKTNSDVEVILHLYQEYDYEAIHHLNGMFAFAIYDERINTLWIARDRLGIKPLFFGWKDDCFGFSSELTGLAKIFDANISDASIIDYLSYSYVPAPNTIYEGISKLNPGEEIILSDKKLSKNIYWQCTNKKTNEVSIDEASAKLDDLLMDSIRMQMISDVPLGVFLSGGIDSSAIAAYAAASLDNIALETFTIDFEDKKGEDTYFANEVSRRLKTKHNLITVSAEDQFNCLDELIDSMDEPMSDSAIVPTYLLSKAARDKGMKVMLSGAGGDEIFGGYIRHFPKNKFSAGWFASLPKYLRRISSSLFGIINKSHKTRFMKPSRNFAASISGVNFEFLYHGLKSKNHYQNILEKIDKEYSKASSISSHSLMHIDVNDYLPNNILSLTDKATMIASVEGRVPLLDHRIVEFIFSIDEKINILNGEEKGLFKKTLKNKLPAELFSRKKEGFNAPINSWIHNWPERVSNELLKNFSPILNKIIDKGVIKKWLSSSKLRSQGGETLYALYILNKWLNRHANKAK